VHIEVESAQQTSNETGSSRGHRHDEAERETTFEIRNVRRGRRLHRTWTEEELVTAVACLPEQLFSSEVSLRIVTGECTVSSYL
jgi:hypothetical protein